MFRKILIVILVAGSVCSPALDHGLFHEDGAAHAAAAKYRCPMHPQIVSDKPGDCPICHMRLVPIEHAEHAVQAMKTEPGAVCAMHDCPMEKSGEACPMLVLGEKGETVECPYCREKIKLGDTAPGAVPEGYVSVLVSAERRQLIGIRTAPASRGEIRRQLRTVARVAYDPALYEAQIEYLREFREARGSLRNRELAFKNLVDSKWEAPRIDVAKSKLVLMGMDEESIAKLVEDAKADASLLYVEPEGKAWVYAEVFESDIAQVRRGDRAVLEAPGTDETYEARVDGVGAMVDPETRRIRVRIAVKNEKGIFRPGMLLNARIESVGGEGILVPAEALFFTGTGAVVFVDAGGGAYEPRRVSVGSRSGTHYEIKAGLKEGEPVVVNGNFLLDSDSRLQSAIAAASSPADAHAGHGERKG